MRSCRFTSGEASSGDFQEVLAAAPNLSPAVTTRLLIGVTPEGKKNLSASRPGARECAELA